MPSNTGSVRSIETRINRFSVLYVYIACGLFLFASGCTPKPEPIPKDNSAKAAHSAPVQPETPKHVQAVSSNRENSGQASPIFVDATAKSGIEFVHFNGTTGEYYLPEITGAGGALWDYDNDGDLDLYLVQGAYLKAPADAPQPAIWPGDQPPSDRLYRNELVPHAELRFTDVTEQAGIQASAYGMGVATGDFNNDGWIDLYVTNLGENQLWRNNGDSTFTDVTKVAGVGDTRWSTSAAFLDYDRDGWLDLFVANYVDFSTEYKRECFSASSTRDYCGPTAYDPVSDRLFRNRGDGTFEDVSSQSGITQTFGAGLGVVVADFNGDQWLDIYVANDGNPNQMWINQAGSGRFQDESLLGGTAVNRMGLAEAGMGVDAADFDCDGDVDLFMTHIERESNTLYVNLGEGLFEDLTIQRGLHEASLNYTSFGTRFVDYDNDGFLDLLVLNGAVRVIDSQARRGEVYPLRQPNQLFQNQQGEKFVEVAQQSGSALQISEVSRGAAIGDVDNDGDVDVVIINSNGPARLLLNEVGAKNHWLGLRVLEQDGVRDCLQAQVEIIESTGTSKWYRVHTDGSFCSASDPRILVGLGDKRAVGQVRVHWPDGSAEVWSDLPVNQYTALKRGTGESSARKPQENNE